MRGVRRTAVRVLGCVAALCLLSSCGGSPTAVSGTIAAYLGISVSGGSYTATLDNQTYSANGAFPLALTAGTHTISGSFRGSVLVVVFTSGLTGGGGVLSGSVRSTSGPSPTVQGCTVGYDNFSTPTTSRSFSLTFQTTTNNGSACQ